VESNESTEGYGVERLTGNDVKGRTEGYGVERLTGNDVKGSTEGYRGRIIN
jgi:hypothetical protein